LGPRVGLPQLLDHLVSVLWESLLDNPDLCRRVRSETAAVLHLVIVRCVSSAFERLVRDLVAGSGATAVFVAWADRFAALREFYPLARREDWQLAACFWLVSRHRL
jgi:hypothetical protein